MRSAPSDAAELMGAPAPRRCGRCRGAFPGDITLPLDLDTGWWVCAPCRELLLGPTATALTTWRRDAAATKA